MKLLFLSVSLLSLLSATGCDRAGERGMDTRMNGQDIERQEEMDRVEGAEYREIPEGEELDVEQQFEDEVEIDD
ncbi:MAG TPA: hypothetical protein VNJ01_07590 [Bacteriovoracaceae bacterium]|nr:hypothetical protein [Bacteriovoracaceae bacterium]